MRISTYRGDSTYMKDRNKYFEQFKPIRNQLRQYNLFDSLAVIREYAVAFDSKKERRFLRNIEKSDSKIIMPNIIDFCIANSIIYSQTLPVQKSISRYKDRYKLTTAIEAIENQINEYGIDQNVWLWLQAFGLNQSKQYTGIIYSNVYRYYMIFNNDTDLRNRIESMLGISYHDYVACSLWIYSVFGSKEGFCVPKSYLFSTGDKFKDTPFTKNNVNIVLSLITKSLPVLRDAIKEYASYDETMFWLFNSPHIHFPLIEYNSNIYCVSPQYLLNQITSGIYYMADIPNANLVNQFGKSFEKYVGYIISENNENHRYSISSEVNYDNGKKTSDWIIQDDFTIVFVECKTKRLQEQSKSQLTMDGKNNPLSSDITKIATGVRQLYKVYNDYRNNKVDKLHYDSTKQFVPILVTLEYMLPSLPTINDKITDIVRVDLSELGIDPSIVDTYPYHIIPMSDFEYYIQIMMHEGFENYFKNKTLEGDTMDYRKKFEYKDYFKGAFSQDFIDPYRHLDLES